MKLATSEQVPVAPPALKIPFFLNGNFALLWTAQSISVFGSHITRDGLPLAAALTLHATPLEMGLLAACSMLPVLFVGLLAGVWVDRMRRRPILITADIGRAALLITIPVMAVYGTLTMPYLYAIVALVGTLDVFFTVADQSLLPSLVRHEHLVAANSKLSTTESMAEIAGPTMAGVLVQVIGAPLAMLGDSLSFLLSALCLSFIHVPEQVDRSREEPQSTWQDIRAGLTLVAHQKLLRTLTLSASLATFSSGAFATLYSFYVVRELHLSPTIYGVLVTMGGIGALVGSLLVNRLTKRFGMGRTLTCAALLSGSLALTTPLATGPTPLIIALLALSQFIGDTAMAIYMINEISLRQLTVPSHLLGRANATVHVLVGGMLPLGALLAGWLSESLGVRTMLLLGACGILIARLLLLSPAVRSAR